MGDKGSTTTADTKILLSDEARAALTKELGLFNDVVQPAQGNVENQLLSILGRAAPTADRSNLPGLRGAADTLGLPALATSHAAAARGIATPNVAQAIEHLRTNVPQLLDLIRGHALQSASQTDSFTDPRFAQFLRPDIVNTSETSPGSGAVAGQAAGLALSVAGIAAAII